MARITTKQIQEILTEDGWKLVSTEYKNLQTEMEFKCEEGHTVHATWGKIRLKRVCPICEQNIFKNPESILIPKKKGVARTLALDQATYFTGWAIFDAKSLVQYGVFSSSGAQEWERFHSINMWLISMIQNWKPDYIGLEGIQYQQNIGVTTFQTLARLQGVLGETCVLQNIDFKVCPTNTWRAHCGVKGRARADRKRSMQILVKEWYDIQVDDDCADAIGIGKFLSDTKVSQIEVQNWE